MKALNKYWFLFLTVLIFGAGSLGAQEREKMRTLRELKQLEKGYVEVDEIDPLAIISIPDIPDVQDVYFNQYKGLTKINLRKKAHNLSMSHTYHFNVEEKYSGINFFIVGDVIEGSIKIKLIKPDKTIFRDIRIVPGQDYDWNQSFTLDKVKKGGIGRWTLELACDHATGFYQFVSSSK